MIRWFKTKRALIKELREYQTAFDSRTASFERHRIATKKTAEVQQQTIARLDLALDRTRLAAGIGIARPVSGALPWQDADAIAQDADAKRLADGLGD